MFQTVYEFAAASAVEFLKLCLGAQGSLDKIASRCHGANPKAEIRVPRIAA
jgi:hypothetical protein